MECGHYPLFTCSLHWFFTLREECISAIVYVGFCTQAATALVAASSGENKRVHGAYTRTVYPSQSRELFGFWHSISTDLLLSIFVTGTTNTRFNKDNYPKVMITQRPEITLLNRLQFNLFSCVVRDELLCDYSKSSFSCASCLKSFFSWILFLINT